MSNFNPEKKKQKSLAIWGFVALLSALLLSNLAGNYIKDVFFGLAGALMPILLAIILAYLLKKLVNFLEEGPFKNAFKNSKNKINKRRTLVLTIVFVVITLFIALIVYAIVPTVVDIASDLGTNTNSHISEITLQLTDLASSMGFSSSAQQIIEEGISNFTANIENYMPQIIDSALNLAASTTMIILNVLLSLLLALLMLKDKEKIAAFFKRIIYANFKSLRADNILKTASRSDKILYSYFIGKVIEALIIFVTVSISFVIIGVPYAFVLALIVAVLNFIPYVGVVIALIPVTVLTIIFGSVTTALWAIACSLIIVIIVTGTISPAIFGRQLNISTLLVILSIIIGGGMFGILGMLFAPPVLAIISVLVTENLKQKEEMKALARSHGLTEEDLMDEDLLIEAGKIKRTKNKS